MGRKKAAGFQENAQQAATEAVIQSVKSGGVMLNMHDVAALTELSYRTVAGHYRHWRLFNEGKGKEPHNPLKPDQMSGATPLFTLETVIRWMMNNRMGRPRTTTKK